MRDYDNLLISSLNDVLNKKYLKIDKKISD